MRHMILFYAITALLVVSMLPFMLAIDDGITIESSIFHIMKPESADNSSDKIYEISRFYVKNYNPDDTRFTFELICNEKDSKCVDFCTDTPEEFCNEDKSLVIKTAQSRIIYGYDRTPMLLNIAVIPTIKEQSRLLILKTYEEGNNETYGSQSFRVNIGNGFAEEDENGELKELKKIKILYTSMILFAVSLIVIIFVMLFVMKGNR